MRSRFIPLLALILVSLVAGPAGAKKGQKKKKRVTSGAAARTEADELAEKKALDAAEARNARTPTVVAEKKREKVELADKPTLKFVDYGRRGIELKVAKKRKELIDFLDQILSQDPPEEEKPDLLFQKAELYLEESQFHFFEGMQYDDAVTAAENETKPKKKEIKKLKKAKKAELATSKQWQEDAINIYREIEENYPKFNRMPEVLYALGRALWDRNEFKEALPIYRKIIKQHPKSQYVADAWLAFGEYFFEFAEEDDRDLNKALNAYQESAKFEDNPVFGYAVYKQGWCWYNLGEHDKAADRFKEVVLYSQLNSDLLGERRIGLSREARRDYVLAYSHYGRAKNADKEFSAIASDDKDKRTMLERLGDIFYGDGKDREAIIIYRRLMDMDKENTRNPLFQGKIVKLASRIGAKRQVVGQARKLVEEYKRVRESFTKMKEGSADYGQVRGDLEAADDVSDNTLRFLATTWHNEAKKTRDDQTFEYAYELYGDYLELFPDRKEAYEIRFFYAELLFKLERFEQAGEQYIRVFQQNPEGKWSEPSAEEAVRAYDEVVKDYDRANQRKPASGPDALKPRPLPAVKKKYIAACNNYYKRYPKGEIAVEASYKVARVLYDYNYFDESTPRFMELVERHATSKKKDARGRAMQSANLVLDSFNILEDWESLHDAARAFSRNRGLTGDTEFKGILDQVLEESSFKLISDYESKKEFEEAAQRYLAFESEFGVRGKKEPSKLADKALANAAAMFTRAGQLDRAIKVRMKLVKAYPKSSLVPDQIYAVATSFEQVVDYVNAAKWLEKFVDLPENEIKAGSKGDPRVKDALFNASIYWEGVGKVQKAVDVRQRYLKYVQTQKPFRRMSTEERKEVETIAYSIPVAYVRAKKKDKATEAFLTFAKDWRKNSPAQALVAQYKAVRLLEKKLRKRGKAGKKARKVYDKEFTSLKKMAVAYKKAALPPEDAGEALGYLAFQDAEEVYKGFLELEIEKPDNPKAFRKTLTAKREGKDKVLGAYKQVVSFKDPEWAVASLYMIGKTQVALVDAILKVPPPKGLSYEQQQLFKDKLSEQTLPIEEGATETMVLCLDESSRFGVFNKWTRKCLSHLEERRPDTYPKNNLEARTNISVEARPPEQGKGMIFVIPKRGQKPTLEAGTEPPPVKPAEGEITPVRFDPDAAANAKKAAKNGNKNGAKNGAKTNGEAEAEDGDDFSFDGDEL